MKAKQARVNFSQHQTPRRTRQDLARPGDESEDDEDEKMDHTGSHFVMLERNKFRKVGQPWNLCHNV